MSDARRRRLLPPVLAALGLAPAAVSEIPGEAGLAVPPHRAVYHASVRGIPVRAGVLLEQYEGGTYQYSSWVEPRGLLGLIRRELTEISLIAMDDGQVQPLIYRKRDEFSERHSDMHFDHAAREVRIDFRGQSQALPWEPGLYDFLSLRLALAHDLASEKLADVYRVVDDRGRIEDVKVEIAARETLDTPLGAIATVRLEYRSSRRDRLFRLWIAPAMDSALVAFEQHEGGRLRGRLSIAEYQRLTPRGD